MMKFRNRFYHTLSAGLVMALLLITFLVPAQQLHAVGNTYYVAENGADNNPGTEAEPWLTIDHATSTMVFGDTTYVKTGTYNEFVSFDNSGTSGNPITLKNYPGDSPIIDGTGLADPSYAMGLISIFNKSYINVAGFEIKSNPYYQGVLIYRSGENVVTDVTLKNLVIHDNNYSGIYAYAEKSGSGAQIEKLIIDGCHIYHNNYAPGDEALALVYVNNFEIKNCTVHDPYSNKEGIDCKQGCTNGKIHNNDVYNSNSAGIYIDGYDTEQNNIDVYCNKVHDNLYGIVFGCETGNYMQEADFYNNLIYNNMAGFVTYGTFPTNKTYTLINNTFYLNTDSQAFEGQSAEYNINCIVRNNIFIGEDSDTYLFYYGDYEEGGVTVDNNLFYSLNGYNRYNVYGTDYIYGSDPLLNNPTSDFRIAYNSPAKDSGSSTLVPAFDFAGTARPQGAGYDIGAYEYEVSTTPPTVTTNAASGLTTTGATLNANLTSKGSASTVTVSFEYGPTTAYGSTATGIPPTLTSTGAFTASLTGLTPNTTYHYRAKAVGDGTTYGSDQQFTTYNINSPPVLASIGNKSVTEGQLLQFIISANDPDGDNLTYSASNLPDGASFDQGTRTFSWTPGYDQSGVYDNIHFEVSDGEVPDSEDITIIVNGVNEPYDVNNDGVVNVLDMISVGQHWGEEGTNGWIPEDINSDGVINVLDIILIIQNCTE
jgi:hypothetical protein